MVIMSSFTKATLQSTHILRFHVLTLYLFIILLRSNDVSATFTTGILSTTTMTTTKRRNKIPSSLSMPSFMFVRRGSRPRIPILQASSVMDLMENPIVENNEEEEEDNQKIESKVVDNRPFAQRVNRVRRPARRLNHGFKYLYRHDDGSMPIIVSQKEDKDDDKRNNSIAMTSIDFLVTYGGYSEKEVYDMNRSFPPLLSLDVQRHLRPKLRFLQETICGHDGTSTSSSSHGVVNSTTASSSETGTTTSIRTLSEDVRKGIPPQYYGARLERTIAPRHAFLVYQKLPHGQQLLMDNGKGGTLWQDFLVACRKPKQFCALCNTWRQKYPPKKNDDDDHSSNTHNTKGRITIQQIESFDTLFQRGLMPASRNELCQSNNTWPLENVNVSSGDMIELLVQHGANPLERDARGASLLHWAAGCGNLDAVKRLLPYFPEGVQTATERDGATPLHWAAAGANAREFGIGGHTDVCRYLLEEVHHNHHHHDGANSNSGDSTTTTSITAKQLANNLTKDGNSVLMWASWSGTLDAVKLLVRNRADPTVANRNGCTVAHWATSGGNLEVCRYLAETVGVDFTIPNYGGNTPLTHAVAFGRVDVVEWLRSEICQNDQEDDMAARLARDFVGWTEGTDKNRQQVLNLFEDWYGDTEPSSAAEEEEDHDDFDFY